MDRRRHKLSHGRKGLTDRPGMTRHQEARIKSITGIAHALDMGVEVVQPKTMGEPAHMRLREGLNKVVNIVVYEGGDAARFAAHECKPLDPRLENELGAGRRPAGAEPLRGAVPRRTTAPPAQRGQTWRA